MTSAVKAHSRLPELDALRGIAALLVVTFHITMFYDNRYVLNTFKFGMTGVQLFFIISGFVIFMSISNVQSGKEFIVNRFARLYPIYWVCVSLTFLLRLCNNTLIHHPITAGDLYKYATNLTMVQYYFKVPDMEDPYWSLIIELLFYVLIYIIYKLKLLRFTVHIFFSLVVAELILLLLHLFMPGNDLVNAIVAAERYFPLIHHLPLFLAGIIFYKIFTEGGNIARYFIVLVCFITQSFEYPNLILSLFNITQLQFAQALSVYFILFFLFVRKQLRFIVGKFTVFLGRISYALYLFHQFLATVLVVPFLANNCHLPYWLSCVCALILVIAIAAFNTIFIDEPLRSKIKKAFLVRR